MATSRRTADCRYVRELVSRGIVPQGLSSSLVNRIASGEVHDISNKQYNKFRSEYYREVRKTFTDHNVDPYTWRTRRDGSTYRGRQEVPYGLDLGEIDLASQMTDYGLPWEESSNEVAKWSQDVPEDTEDRAEVIEKQHADEIERYQEELTADAESIVINNGLGVQWIKEGKLDFHHRPIRTHADAVAMMQSIMALGRRSKGGWDRYVVERNEKEQWHPVEFKYDKKNKTTVRQFVQDTNPKYVDWQRRMSTGEIVIPDHLK
jgi:hypothetical protein